MSARVNRDGDALRVERVENLEDIREDWLRLADLTSHPFATWEWVTSWWRWFGAGRPLYTFACRDSEGAVVAILPMYLAATRPVRVARFLGYSDLHSPICAPADRPRAARAMLGLSATRGKDGCRFLLAERLPGGEGWDELLGGTLTTSHADPLLRIDGTTWEEFLASRSQNFRREVGRQERRLERDYELTYRMADDPDRLDSDVTTLFRLHNDRWDDETTGMFLGDRGSMHRELAAEALERGWLRLWFLELDGEPVAANYSWRFAGSDWCLQQGRDPAFERQKVGGTLMAHVIREAHRDGMSTFRFLAGDEAYKGRWTNEDTPAETRLLASGPIGRAGGLAIKRVRSLPGPVRRRVMNLIG